MKSVQIMSFMVVAFFCISLVGCANVSTLDQGIAPPAPPQEFKKEVVEKKDQEFFRKLITEKIGDLSAKALEAVNNFIDAHARAEVDEDTEVLVFTAEKNGFPFFLEEVMRSNELLNTLPREKERLVLVENEKAPGVKNVYYLVKGSDVPEGKQMIMNWIPNPERFNKHIDPTVNMVEEDRSQEWMFVFLFYQGNVNINPDLIAPVIGADKKWDWDRMPHPKDTFKGAMLIPIATVKNGAMEKILQ